MKKVLIIGTGAQATVITGVLAAAEDVDEIVLTDIDQSRAQGIADTNGSRKIKAEKIDASNTNLMVKRMISGKFDLVVNATIPKFVRQVMEASLKAGINYLDMASNEIYWKADIPIEQLDYADKWKGAGLLCLTGAGGDPGLSNIMAKEAVEELDIVNSIRIKDYGEADSDTPVALWSMRTYLEDLYLPSTQTVGGEHKKFPMFTGEEDYLLPEPFNKTAKFYYHDHEEGVTIPLFCGKPVDYCDFKIGEPVAMWSFQTYLEDCSDEAIYWEDNQYKYAEPFSGEEEYYFPPPLDLTGKVFYHNHEEPVTIPQFIGKPVKYVDFKMGDPDSATWEFMLNGLKLMDTTPVDIKGSSVSVKDVFCNQLPETLTPKKCIELVKAKKIQSQAVLAVDVKGTKEGRKLHFKMWTDSPNIEKACTLIPGTNDVSWITSVPASVLSNMILRGQIKRTGVFPCEVLDKDERKLFFQGIKEWDVIIHKQVTSDID